MALMGFYAYASVSQIGRVENIQELIKFKARKFGLDVALVRAIIKIESNFEARAKNPADPSYGYMQITPMLAQDYGLVRDYRNPTYAEIQKIYEPSNNLDIGCWFLSNLLKRHSFDEAVQMYNIGETGYSVYGRRNLSYLEKVRKAYGLYS